MNAVVVLTRGYSNLSDYAKLTRRNKHISDNLKDTNIPIVIFHEGNIIKEHQTYICDQSPTLNFLFCNVKEDNLAFRKEKDDINKVDDPVLKNFPKGYFHMCCFWFVDFWHFVGDYDKILRIDEDCYIDFSIDDAFERMTKKKFLYGSTFQDNGVVIKGMNDFSKTFCEENKIMFNKRRQIGPYTNVFGVNLKMLTNNTLIHLYIKQVDLTNNIYIYRWGDLPLWGELMYYLFDIDVHANIDRELKYWHGSHGKKVNY